jgi:hypothetical protein
MHDFRALGVEDEATRALLYAIASIRRGGYTAAFSHVTHLSDLFAQGQVPQIDESDPKFAKALSLALTDRYSEAQARAVGDNEHQDPKQHANPKRTRPTTRAGTLATDALPPEAVDAPAERGPGQLPDPNAEDGGLTDAAPPEEDAEDGEEQGTAPKKRGRRAKKAEAEPQAAA